MTASTSKWMLEEVRDTNNNYIKYEYYKDSGQIYPDKIKYTGYNTTDGIFEIAFFRESRSDKAKMYSIGYEITTNYRINEIQMKVNGAWSKKLALNYSAGDNNSNSLLSTITESGQDEQSNTVSLPSNGFEYQKKEHAWHHDTNYNIPISFLNELLVDRGAVIEDVNGDALADIVLSDARTQEKKVYINKGDGTGWQEKSSYTIPQWFSNGNGTDYGVRFADVNGDGLADLLYGSAYWGRKVYINQGNDQGWPTEDMNFILPANFVTTESRDAGTRLADVNGDGLIDILSAPYGSSGTVLINKGDGTGWVSSPNYTIPVAFLSVFETDQGVRLVDVNGDGLVDIVYSEDNEDRKVYINKGDGTGWQYQSSYNIPLEFSNGNGTDWGVRFADVNGDGLTDLLFGDPDIANDVYLNKGDGLGWNSTSTIYTSPNFLDSNGDDTGIRLANVNGDGLVDFVQSDGTNNTVNIALDSMVDRLIHAETDKNAELDIYYKNTPEYLDTNNGLLNPEMPIDLETVESMVFNDGIGNRATTTYEYSGGDFYYNNAFDKRFAGFQKIKKTDDYGNYSLSYYHQGNTSSSTIGEYNDDQSKIGRVYRIEQYDPNNNLYAKTINKWENYDLGSEADFVKLTRTTEFAYDGDTDHKEKAATYEYDNNYGNPTTKISWGEVSGSDDGSFTDTGTDKASTTITYAASTTLYIVGLPSREITNDQNSNKAKETKYYYDNLSIGSVSKGNLTKEESWKASTSYIDIERTYNSYGLVTAEKDPRDKTTTSTYDSYYLYVATSTNPLNQAVQYYYDYSCGKAKKTIDPNNRVFETVFDGLDRPIQEKQPDIASPSTLAAKRAYAYYDFLNPRSIKITDYLDATTSIDSFTYLDGLDRPIQDRKRAEDADTYSTKDYSYNKLGLVEKESLPYFSTGTSTTAATTTNSLYAIYAYDALARVKTVANAVGTTTTAYDDWKQTITDAEGNAKDLYYDAYDNLSQVDEHNDSSTYSTIYTYNLLGKLTKIQDALSNVRNFTYDGLARLTKSEDLHATGDSTFGSTTLAYDDSGNLTAKTDAKNQTVNFTYDDINRALTEDYAGQAGTEITYGYDSCAEGKGRLCSATSTGAVVSYAYNALGLAKTEGKKIDSTTYTTQYDYDR